MVPIEPLGVVKTIQKERELLVSHIVSQKGKPPNYCKKLYDSFRDSNITQD